MVESCTTPLSNTEMISYNPSQWVCIFLEFVDNENHIEGPSLQQKIVCHGWTYHAISSTIVGLSFYCVGNIYNIHQGYLVAITYLLEPFKDQHLAL